MGNLTSVAIGMDGTVAVTDKDQNVWLRAARMSYWTAFNDAKAIKVSCARQDHLWLLNAAGDIFQRQGNTWVPQHLGAKFVDICTAADGTVWAIDTNQGLWFRTHATPAWAQERQGRGVQVAVGNRNTVWLVTATGDLYQFVNNAWVMKKKGAAATTVSVGNDGTVWYIGAGGRAYRPQGNDWVPDPQGIGVQVAVRNASEAWLLTLGGDIWQMTANRWTPVTPPRAGTPPLTGGGSPSTPGTTTIPAKLYKVVAGDAFSALAQKFGVTMDTLLKANPQVKNANSLKVGEVLTIPAVTTAHKVYSVQPGDTMGVIAQRFGVDYEKLVQANPHIVNANYINVGDTVYIPQK